MKKTQTYLKLEKENFKFSSAHFLIFDQSTAEMLHGHNYRVRIKLYSEQASDSANGYLIDFSVVKKIVKDMCDQWDEHVLLPEKHPDMKYTKNTTNYDIHFRDRFYSFPIKETIWLPVTNTSVEQLSHLFANNLSKQLSVYKLTALKVNIEETNGQSATTRIDM